MRRKLLPSKGDRKVFAFLVVVACAILERAVPALHGMQLREIVYAACALIAGNAATHWSQGWSRYHEDAETDACSASVIGFRSDEEDL